MAGGFSKCPRYPGTITASPGAKAAPLSPRWGLAGRRAAHRGHFEKPPAKRCRRFAAELSSPQTHDRLSEVDTQFTECELAMAEAGFFAGLKAKELEKGWTPESKQLERRRPPHLVNADPSGDIFGL